MYKFKAMPSGYGIVQTSVMKMPGVTIQGKAIYALLASYTGNKEFCFPSLETIGKDVGLSKPMVVKYVKELEAVGLIRKSRLYPDSKMKKHSKYEVMLLDEEEGARGKVHLTSEVKPALPSRLNTLNLGGKAHLTQINNIDINNSPNKKAASGGFEKIVENTLKDATPRTRKDVWDFVRGQSAELRTAMGKRAYELIRSHLEGAGFAGDQALPGLNLAEG